MMFPKFSRLTLALFLLTLGSTVLMAGGDSAAASQEAPKFTLPAGISPDWFYQAVGNLEKFELPADRPKEVAANAGAGGEHLSVTAMDVNRDGFIDAIITVTWSDKGRENDAKTYVFLGTENGISSRPAGSGSPE